MEESVKIQIDKMTYEDMLSRNSFAPVGDPMFQGEVGQYFQAVMREKGDKLLNEEKVQISKDLGWG